MEITVHGTHVMVPDDLRRSAVRKTERLGRYLVGMERAVVSFSDTSVGHLGDPITCEVVIEGRGHIVRAVGVGGRPAVALDAAVDKAALRLARLKRKLVGRSRPRHGRGKSVANGVNHAAVVLQHADGQPDDDIDDNLERTSEP